MVACWNGRRVCCGATCGCSDAVGEMAWADTVHARENIAACAPTESTQKLEHGGASCSAACAPILQHRSSRRLVSFVLGDIPTTNRRLCFVLAYLFPLRYDRVARVIERGLEAMRDLNGRSAVAVGNDASSGPSGWKASKGDEESPSSAAVSSVDPSSSQKVIKRSRLPAAAVKEMRWAACGIDHVAAE